ncbi:hypothetical protein LBMAG27_04110 [Bacteroidota bacterium]|nr:hypothetical protein LBMAG27_04110 [Bacteroidota bacterium]
MTNDKKTSLAAGMWKMKCPNCRKGDLFQTKNPWILSKLDSMPPRCSVCNQSYFPEVGFYYGAMYISYMVSIAVEVPIFLLMLLFFGFQIVPMVVTLCTSLVFFFPYIYRYSRVLWIYVTIPFESYKKL